MTREEGLNICIDALSAHEDGSKEYFMLTDSLKRALNEDIPVFDIELFQAGLMDVPDGMTIGKIIEAMLPNAEIDMNPHSPSVDIFVDGFLMIRVDRNYWKASYKNERKVENDSTGNGVKKRSKTDDV